jgi:hypothetical protein
VKARNSTGWIARLCAAAAAGAAAALTFVIAAGTGAAEPARATALPRNTSPPTITGTQRVGQTLTGNPGGWSGTSPVTFTFQWIRCNSQLANCAPIAGATSRQHTLTPDDLGRRLIFFVTARNAEGSSNARASTGVIRARGTAPTNTSPPTISGTPREGSTLTASNGTWSGSTPITFAHQWQRCDANGGSCSNVIGATKQTYTLTSADVRRTMRVVVTARNAAGSRSRTSVPTGPVEAGPPPGPGGQIKLPSGKVSVPIENVSLPARLVIDEVRFSPNPVRSRRRPITIRVHVSDTRGFAVRGALVFVRSTPLLTSTPPESATTLDGWVTLRTTPRAPRPGLVFPLRRGLNVQFYVQARKPGERLLFGVTGTRLSQVHTAAPR